jgi:hypothetical protein
MPTSCITAIAVGCTRLASKPELVTSSFPAPSDRANPSAICDRQEFRLHTNITRFITPTSKTKWIANGLQIDQKSIKN